MAERRPRLHPFERAVDWYRARPREEQHTDEHRYGLARIHYAPAAGPKRRQDLGDLLR